MIIFGLKTCDSCRKAIKSLPDAAFVDVRSEGVPDDVMRTAQATFGEALINRRSTTWRGLTGTERDLPPDRLLSENPTLMKRPLIVDQDRMHLGWTNEVQSALGVNQG